MEQTIALTHSSEVQVQTWLRWTFTLVPIIAGADKFLNLLTDWKQYAAPLAGMLPFSTATLMIIVGVIEIAAGVLVFRIPNSARWSWRPGCC